MLRFPPPYSAPSSCSSPSRPRSPTGTPIHYANPLLSSLALLDGPRDLTRNTLSVKADWKVGDNGVLSVGHVASRTDTRIGQPPQDPVSYQQPR